MNRTFKIIVSAAVILLEISVLSGIKVFSRTPDYALVLALALCIICPERESVVLAAFCGLFKDFLSGSVFGLNTLLFMYLSTACVFFADLLYIKKLKILAPSVFLLSLVYEAVFGVVCLLERRVGFTFAAVFVPSFKTAIINTVLFIPVYLILKRVRFEKKIRGIRYER